MVILSPLFQANFAASLEIERGLGACLTLTQVATRKPRLPEPIYPGTICGLEIW